jgi:hypothetical protein
MYHLPFQTGDFVGSGTMAVMGAKVGLSVGERVGLNVGERVGFNVGLRMKTSDGAALGA